MTLNGPRPTPRNPWFDRTFSSGTKRRSLAVVDGTLSPVLPVPPTAANVHIAPVIEKARQAQEQFDRRIDVQLRIRGI